MLKKFAITFFFISLSSAAQSNIVETGPFTVSILRFGDGGLHLALSPAPSGCGGGSQYGMHLKLDPGIPNYHGEMISGLLAAYATGTKLSRIWFANAETCSPSQILHLQLFEYEVK